MESWSVVYLNILQGVWMSLIFETTGELVLEHTELCSSGWI
jgi:hypothetical protein